jgi:cyclohexyl-isocyanide hydratase
MAHQSKAQKRIDINRREFSQQLCGAALSAAIAKMAVAQQQTQDTSGKQHSMPEKPAEIAMLIYPGMTALDLIGPQQVFGYPGVKVELVAKTKDAVRSDTGITIQPSKTFADCADPVDILFVGGGSDGTVALMTDRETPGFSGAAWKDRQARDERLHRIHGPRGGRPSTRLSGTEFVPAN